MWTPKRRAVPSSSMLDVEALERLGLLALSGAATNDAALATHRVLALRDGSHPVAYLVAATKRAVFLLPLREGVTLVGRGSGCEYEASRAELAGVVEGAQWKITCIATHALVQDTGSTNGSVLLGRDDRDAASTGLAALHAGRVRLARSKRSLTAVDRVGPRSGPALDRRQRAKQLGAGACEPVAIRRRELDDPCLAELLQASVEHGGR